MQDDDQQSWHTNTNLNVRPSTRTYKHAHTSTHTHTRSVSLSLSLSHTHSHTLIQGMKGRFQHAFEAETHNDPSHYSYGCIPSSQFGKVGYSQLSIA